MTPTIRFVTKLESLKPGELGRLRMHSGRRLDDSVDGFDLFTGLWWPLRNTSQRAPRREVAWLIAKTFAAYPLPQEAGKTLAQQLGVIERNVGSRCSLRWRFDAMLSLPVSQQEPSLRWAVGLVAKNSGILDWVNLLDALSCWERISTRLRWARQFLRPA